MPVTLRLGRWLAQRKLSGEFWQVLLLVWTINCTAAISMNFVAYLLIWPDALAEEWRTMILLPLIFVSVLTVPIVYLDYALVHALLESRRVYEDEAHRDFLTGVSNRRGFEGRLRADLRLLRTGCFLLLDLDHFKRINDHFGHNAGDRVLAAVGAALRTSVRSSDVVGRIGGEEFAIFMPGLTPEEAAPIIDRLRAQVTAHCALVLGPDADPVTVSGGIACLDNAPARFEELYQAADDALYRAKDLGRDRVEFSADLAAAR